MKVLTVCRKSLRELGRDWLTLSLSLVFAPVFVLIYWVWLPSGSTTYGVLVLNQDAGVALAGGRSYQGGEEVVRALEALSYESGDPLLRVVRAADRPAAEARLRDRDGAVLVVVPPGFSRAVERLRSGSESQPASLTFVGDLTNPSYAIAAALSMAAVEQYVQAATGRPSPVQILEVPLGASAARSEFEAYVPGLLVVSVILLIFPASVAVVRDVESGMLRRLRLTCMTAFDFLGGLTLSLVLVGLGGVVLAFGTAVALGFRSQGPLWAAVLVVGVTTLSSIGVGLIVGCFSKTVNQVLILSQFPLALFLFFSGAAFPIPKVPLFSVGSRVVGLYEVLPTTHATVALNKILTLGEGLDGVAYELAALAILSVVYLTVGVWLFGRTHLRT